MPPSGIDRFNFVVCDPGLEIESGTLEAWDENGADAPWMGEAVASVAGGSVLTIDVADFPATRIRVSLNGGLAGSPQPFVFEADIAPRNPGFWIAYVVIGFYLTPHGPNDFEPFGVLELVDAGNRHKHFLLHKARHIR